MTYLEQISQALLNADAAGDTEAATVLAQEYRKLSEAQAQAQAPQATTDAGYLSQLGSALSIGARQMASGVKATFNAATGDIPDTAAAMAQMGALQKEQQANLSAEEIALNEAFARNKAEYDQARGILPTIGALSGYVGSIASQPGAAFKQAIQSAPNAAISAGTGLAGYALGGLLGAGAGIETGPGAVLTGIAGAVAGGAISNSLMEASPAIYDILNERTNGAASSMTADQITQVLQQNPDIMSEGLKTGAIRGSVIGVIEGLGMKGAGRLMSIPERAAARAVQKTLIGAGVDVASKEAVESALLDPALKNAVSAAAKTAKNEFTSAGNLARLAGASGIEIGASGAGEVGAQVATGQEIDPTAAVQEMMGEVGLSIPVAAVAKGLELARTPQALQTPIQQALARKINAIPTNAVPPQTEDEKRAGAEAGNPILVDPEGNTAAVAPEMWNEAIKRQITPPVEAQAATQPSDVEARLANLMRNPGLTAAVNTADSIVTTAENTSSDVSQATTAARNIIQGVVDTPQPQEAPAELPAVTPSPAMEQLENISQTITDSNGEIAPEMSVLPPTVQAGAGAGEAIAEDGQLEPSTSIEDQKEALKDIIALKKGRGQDVAELESKLQSLGADTIPDFVEVNPETPLHPFTSEKPLLPIKVEVSDAGVRSIDSSVKQIEKLRKSLNGKLARASGANKFSIESDIYAADKALQELGRVGREIESYLKPITPQGTPTPATEGTVMPGGSATPPSRGRPVERVVFEKPIKTPIGEIVSYDWQYKVEEVPDKEGEMGLRRFSDWDQAEKNADTGRDIVHQFTVRKPDGTTQLVSLESALGKIPVTAAKGFKAAIKAARRLPVYEAELARLELQQKNRIEAENKARKEGWKNSPPIELRDSGFPSAMAAGARMAWIGDNEVALVDKRDISEDGTRINSAIKSQEIKTEWAMGQIKTPSLSYGEQTRIDNLRRSIKRDKATLKENEITQTQSSSESAQGPQVVRGVSPSNLGENDTTQESPQTTTVAAPTETAAPSAKEAAVASVVQQPVEGSIPTVEQESAITAIESTEKADVAKEAMRFLEADLTDAQRAKWTPEMFTAAQAFFDSGGKDFDSLKKAIKFPRVVQQAYLKADKEAAAEQTRREAADAAMAREVEKAEKEQAKLEADQKQRDELGLKTLNSLIEKTRTNVVQGTVKSSDANQAVAILNKSGAIPNVLFTWIGTSKDFLADPANRARYPETWKAVSSNPNIEGMSENGQPIVFTDNVGVSDLDRNLAKLQGTTPEIAAVRRVILHENIHKGMFFLSLKDKMKLFQFLHRLYSPEELDQLAKSYDEYSDWRINQVSYFSIIEEAMTRDFDSMAEIPRDGIWAEFMQFLRDIWQKITGKTSEPTLKNYKDVFRLIRNSLKNSEAANADRLKNGGKTKYETNDTSVRPYASEGYGSQRMEGVSTGDNSPRAQAIRKAVSESNWNELSPTQRAKALEEFGLQSIQSRYSFDSAILPVRVTNERTPKNRPASILSAGPSPAITIQFDTSGLADLLSGDAVTAFANVFDIAQEEVIHAAQHINIYNRWKTSKSTDSVGLYELKHYTSMINEVAKIAGDELRSGNPAVANIFTNAWNLYNPNNRAADVNDAIGKIKSAPEAAAFAMELSRMMLQMQRQDFTTETGWMRFVEAMKAMLADITNALRTALAMAKNGQVGKRLQDEISEINALINDLESASQPMASKVTYDSPNEAAFNSGAEVARNADYDERDKAVRSTIRAAYDLAPKDNGPSVPLDQLFDIAKQSMPDLTENEFSQILQDLYEDSGALLQAGESPFIVTTPDGQRAGSAIIVSSLPTGAMASTIDPESDATKKFVKDIQGIESGTLKAAFGGRQFFDFEPVEYTVRSNKSYEQTAINYVNNFIAEGGTLEQMANSVIAPNFLAGIGIEDDVMARQALVAEVKNRVVNAGSKKKSKVDKKFFERLNQRISAFWQGVGSKGGRNQGQRAYIIGNPRYSWMFLTDEVDKELKQRRDNILNVQFGNDNATSFTQNSYENADMASTVSADEVAKDTINDTEWDLIKEGEQVFDGARKTIWERVKFLVARIALYARAEAAEIKSASKASFTDAQRDELASILTMPKAEREKAKAKDLAELDSLMAKLLGEESPTDTPTEKKKRNKRKEIIDTVEKRVKAGEPIEAPEEVETSEDEVTKAEATAQAILKDLSERYSDPLIFRDKKPNINEMRELYKERVKQGNGTSQMTEKTFVNKAIELGADEKTAGILWSAAELEIDAREAMRQDKIRQRNAAAGERADAQAHRIIFAKERLKRQSGFADIDTNPNKDTIIKAFREQVKTPIALDAFIQRLIPLKVSRQVAERLFRAAERENTDLAAMAVYDRTQGPKALKRMVSEINLMRRGEEIPLRTPIPWRKLLSQKAKTVEEYRQRIFDAISANEELKSATPEQKARLADLFTEAWESNRKRILDGMQERLIREKEAKGDLSKKGAEALQEQRMRMVEDINLGIFDNDEIAKIMAEKFGIKSEFTDAEREKIESLIEILQDETLNRVKRNKAAYELLETLSAQTSISIAKLLANFWVSSVLSGMNTVFSIGMSVFSGMGELTTALSRIFSAAFSNPKQLSSEVAAAFKTLARVISAVPRQANRAWQYLVTGDQVFLDPTMNDALKNMDYASIGKNNQLAEQMAKSDKILEKSMGLFMRTISRLLTALDLFNSGLTKEGSLSIVFRQLDLDPAKIQMLEKKSDLKAYKDQVILDYFNNVQPKTLNEKALVESYAMAEMMKALDEIGNVSENADQMAMQGAMTLDPSGLGGYGYRFVKSMMKSAESGTDKLLERNLRKWDEAVGVDEKAEAGVRLVLSYIFQFAAYNAANLVGVRFARFAGNKFNQSLSFLPLIGALRLYEAEFDSDRIRGKEAFTDMIKRNQITGVIAAVIGYYVLKAIAEEPDDEKRGAFINGGWGNLTPEKKQQKLASGQKEYTLGFGDTVINYGNWPGSGILAAIGGLSDLIRFSPDQWNDKTVANKLLSATTSGVFSALEVPALSQFQELFGSSLSSKDPNEQKLTKFARVIGNYAGGFVPRILKDIDYLADPNFRKYETLWEKTASHIPVYRRYEGKEYYDILGQQIQRNIYPGSREFMTKPTDPAYKVLGALNSRGIWLTPANAEHRMVGKGARRRSLTQEEADNYSLETGKGYKQMLLRYGQRALQMPTERARAFLLDKADEVRDRALKKVYRGYQPAS